jgi:N-methylhydantoinase A
VTGATAASRRYAVATDVGGTCTDTVVFAVGEPVHLGKVLSTPPNFADGVLASIAGAAGSMGLTTRELLEATSLFMHASTVVDNVIYTRGGRLTGLITTEGFEDTLPSTRGPAGRWAGLGEDGLKHPVATDRAEPLVTEEFIRGVPERVDYKGAVLRDLDEDAVTAAARYLIEEKGVEAVAVSLLWSFYNPEHEQRIAEIVRRIRSDIYVSLSSDIAPVPGEYERTSTTVINAYSGGIVSSYLQHLQTKLADEGYDGPCLVMQGYGGLLPAGDAAERSIGLLEAGPAAGVIGSRQLGELMGDANVIAADMGGTTFKVGVIQDGELEYARSPLVDRFHYIAAKIEVVSIGAGGGSIIGLDERTGIPKVGPRSAGAEPGPVCYGRGGTEPTLTDVMVLCGYMDPEIFLGGAMRLDAENARRVFERTIAGALGMSCEEAAFGIYQIAAEQTTALIREVTVERGVDPRDFVLHAFGGSCGLMCAVFAEELSVRRVIVPYTAAVNCAFGLVSADIAHEYSLTATLQAPIDPERVNKIYDLLVPRAVEQLRREGFEGDRIRLERSVDLHYLRQVHEVTTPIRVDGPLDERAIDGLIEDFERLYQQKYGPGSTYRGAGIEMTMFRLTARGLIDRPEVPRERLRSAGADHARIGRRDIFVTARHGMAPADIYDFGLLEPGNRVRGPAVIHTPITTIVVQEGQESHVDEYRNVVIEWS